jgi:hypothetical protein
MRYSFFFAIYCLTLLPARSQTQQEHTGSLNSQTSEQVLHHLPDNVLPVIGAWFWDGNDFKKYLDQVNINSCFNLLSTATRSRDITDANVHNQIKLAVAYAKELGIKIALELDPRVVRDKFESMYPDELQESLWLKEVKLSKNDPVETVVESIYLSDHMTGRKTSYISLRGSLLRVYSYIKTADGIDPNTIKDITKECIIKTSSKDSIVVRIPANGKNSQLQACVMVSFTHLTPDVFAPHLMEFTREIIRDYSDIPLAGGMRDEWGYPPSTSSDRMAFGNHFWYSKFYASAYAKKTGGRDLLDDCLLMYVGIKGQESDRWMAINNYMELNRQRNSALEDDFYHTIKEVFGPEAVVVTHPTWYPYPDHRENKKNGLFWWTATRDWAQTDEVTPFAVRTALAKKWNSPVWYNQYYDFNHEGRISYQRELWSSVLAGGRINYHPSGYSLFTGNLMQGESKVRLLNFISKSPLNCPVAVIFGHPSTLNWAGHYFQDCGMKLVDSLWSMGIPTDLIPTTEIENNSLLVDENGWIRYGKQRYSVVILYNPEFEKLSTALFFNQASKGQTRLFRIGNWKTSFDGKSFDGNATLPKTMVEPSNIESVLLDIAKILKKRKIDFQTPASRILEGFGHISNAPPTKGFCRLIDGTLILAAGTNDVAGDIIDSKMKIGKYEVAFNAVGVAAVRLDEKGHVQALAAGGLKFFKTKDFVIQLDERIDLALWINESGEFKGIIQGLKDKVPPQLLAITKDWVRITVPVPLKD